MYLTSRDTWHAKHWRMRLANLFGYSPALHSDHNPHRLVLLLYSHRGAQDLDATYILKSWGTSKDYTVIRANTLSIMEVA